MARRRKHPHRMQWRRRTVADAIRHDTVTVPVLTPSNHDSILGGQSIETNRLSGSPNNTYFARKSHDTFQVSERRNSRRGAIAAFHNDACMKCALVMT